MRILMIGDVVGRPARRLLSENLKDLISELEIDFTVANGENAAGGAGITADTAGQLFDAGVDVITSGNHIWDQREAVDFIQREPRLLRPVNYPEGTPGSGVYTCTAELPRPVVVVNVHGRVFIPTDFDCPFRTVERVLEDVRSRLGRSDFLTLVDFHGEATSEKQAFGRYFDGDVSAVVGSHTHVQTNDATLLPGGTAYLSDVGMTGPAESIIGMDSSGVMHRFLTQMPVRFEVASGPCRFNAVLLDCFIDESLRPRVRQIKTINRLYK